MDQRSMEPIEQCCRVLRDELDRGWQWDDRLSAALLVYSKADSESVDPLLERVFSSSWTSKTLATASDDVRELVSKAAGLEAGQKFYHSAVEGDVILFAAVWPWGNGKTISLRVGCRASDKNALQQKLKEWFRLV